VERHAPALRTISGDSGSQPVAGASAKEKTLQRKAHQVLRRVSADFESRWHFNTSVALIMELVNTLQGSEPLDQDARPEIVKEALELLVLMLAPIAPHVAEELWEMLGHSSGLWLAKWPQHNAQLAEEEQVEVVIQINGRVRGKIRVDGGLPEDELAELAFGDPRIEQLLRGTRILKRVVVPNKLVNIVVA